MKFLYNTRGNKMKKNLTLKTDVRTEITKNYIKDGKIINGSYIEVKNIDLENR